MDRKVLYTKELSHEAGIFELEYALLECPAQEGKVYGVSITKKTGEGCPEEELVEGITEDCAAAEQFLKKLADGFAFPVTLTAMCDDFLYEAWE
ncbi:MAG: DUF6514 family protein [Bacillota bacterium]|nr:DUF6514 family protein [Bacillota bacterium]